MVALRIAGLAVLWILFVLSPAAGVVTPLGPLFQIDAEPDCQEREPDVATLPGGGFVTVWTGGPAPTAGRIYARIHEEDRNPVTPDLPVSSLGQAQSAPAVATQQDGRFLVVWRADSSGENRGRLFDATGAPLTGEIPISNVVGDVDVAALPDGGFVVAWSFGSGLWMRRLDADGQPEASDLHVVSYGAVTGSDPVVVDPAVAVQPGGDLVVVWTVQDRGIFKTSAIEGVIIPRQFPSSTSQWTRLGFDGPNHGTAWGTTVGADADGDLVVAWREENAEEERRRLSAQLFDAAGQPRGGSFRVDEEVEAWARLGNPELLVHSSGSFVIVWDALLASPWASSAPGSAPKITPPIQTSNAIYSRVFDARGTAQGVTREISPAFSNMDRVSPALAWAGRGVAVVVWQDETPRTPGIPTPCFSSGIGARLLSPGCLPGPGTLCLGEGRFQLEATWTAPFAGGSGQGQAVGVTRDTGYFWFFGPENVELMVKVLDGRAVNGNFWVFYGSLSNVAWTLTVTDLETGARKAYNNPAGQLASNGDTAALPGAASSAAGDVVVQAFESVRLDRNALPAGTEEAPGLSGQPLQPARAAAPSHTPGESGARPCTDPSLPVVRRPGLCLNGQRFEVEVAWHDPFNGGSGVGEGVPLTDDSGYFWFFHPANVELVVKVLDGRPVNGKFWVFYGALTNVEYDIRVRKLTGGEIVYHNLPFQFRSHADTGAFN